MTSGQYIKQTGNFPNIKFSDILTIPTVNGLPATTINNRLDQISATEKILSANILSVHKPYYELIKNNYPNFTKKPNRFIFLRLK
ncbi:MAG: hypothetical protein GXO50_10775 [Chlorobi bacterium]|nr:hypothetical protein [Chlorobiota bacterium]